MEEQAGKTRRGERLLSKASAKLKVLFRALGDILETLWHGFFSLPERQAAVARVKSGDRLQGEDQVTGYRGQLKGKG